MESTNLDTLTNDVCLELERRNYSCSYIACAISEWQKLANWCSAEQRKNFTSEVAFKYLDEKFGYHIIPSNRDKRHLRSLRRIRLLISYLKDGTFEFRSPRIEIKFNKEISQYVVEFLKNAASEGKAKATIDSYSLSLRKFSQYMDSNGLTLKKLDIKTLEGFFEILKVTPASIAYNRSVLRFFFLFLFKKGVTERNLSLFVLKENSASVPQKTIDTYSEGQIRNLLASIERTSAIGKRNYLVVLLASTYGLRSSDITNLKFSEINWAKNRIEIMQKKTQSPLVLPLLSVVGNAIIDYYRNGRPKEALDDTIVVSHMQGTRGKHLKSPTIHSIVKAAFFTANISGWKEKKHGAHSLRHSLATNMLKRNVSMPIISTVLGHRNTETTKTYLTVDVENLRKCSLPIPVIKSDFYATEHGDKK